VALVRFDVERSRLGAAMMTRLVPWYPIVTIISLIASSAALLFFVIPQLEAAIVTYVCVSHHTSLPRLSGFGRLTDEYALTFVCLVIMDGNNS
jgi:type II secretory pathway component PulF